MIRALWGKFLSNSRSHLQSQIQRVNVEVVNDPDGQVNVVIHNGNDQRAMLNLSDESAVMLRDALCKALADSYPLAEQTPIESAEIYLPSPPYPEKRLQLANAVRTDHQVMTAAFWAMAFCGPSNTMVRSAYYDMALARLRLIRLSINSAEWIEAGDFSVGELAALRCLLNHLGGYANDVPGLERLSELIFADITTLDDKALIYASTVAGTKV